MMPVERVEIAEPYSVVLLFALLAEFSYQYS